MRTNTSIHKKDIASDSSSLCQRISLNHLQSIGALTEVSGKKRDKVYIYRKYLDILEDGAKPFSKEKS